MDKYSEYEVGDWVEVKGRRVEEYNGNQRGFRLQPDVQKGQIVGATHRPAGTYKPWVFGDPEPACFVPSGPGFFFWLVRLSLLNKPIHVFAEDITRASRPEGGLPVMKSGMSAQCRKFLSEDSKQWPRDKKGRWVPEPLQGEGG